MPEEYVLTADRGKSDSEAFVYKAYQYNQLLIYYGEDALKHVEKASVRSFIELSLPLHQKQSDQLVQYLQQLGAKVPQLQFESMKSYLEKEKLKPNQEYEQDYLQTVSSIQHKALPLYEQATQLSDTTLANWANNVIPKLEMHAESVDQLLEEM